LESRGGFLLSLDSDDELYNQTAEIDLLAAQRCYADMVEHRAVVVMPDGSIYPWPWPARITEADNVTMVRLGIKLAVNWQLWLRLIERVVYFQGMTLVGQRYFFTQNARGTDLLHNVAMYPFVRKFITIEYIGYKYYMALPENSAFRSFNPQEEVRRVIQIMHLVLNPFIEADANLSQTLRWIRKNKTIT
jgi:hypothetical protein